MPFEHADEFPQQLLAIDLLIPRLGDQELDLLTLEGLLGGGFLFQDCIAGL